MKKLLIIFLLGQLLLLSYIFNQSIYAIYELNSLGDTTLTSYLPNDASGDTLSKLYDEINETCMERKECSLQVIKNPVPENGNLIYDIYHNDIESLDQIETIFDKKQFKYYQLEKADFVDHDGVFYSNISQTQIKNLEENLAIKIETYDNFINYKQIITYNLFNFIILLIVSQLVLFIYTFTRIKVNTVKKVLGFTPAKMVRDSLNTFLLIEFGVAIVTILIHFIYYSYINHLVTRYFLLLGAFLIIAIIMNVLMLLLTQISLTFIDIGVMIKNKTYSNRLNYGLYTIKIILILTITLSMSLLINNYQNYREKTEELKVYEKLNDYYTSIGYNAVQDQVAKNNEDILEDYGENIKSLYRYYDQNGKMLTLNVSTNISFMEASFVEERLKLESFYNNINLNYIVVNKNYLEKFVSTSGTPLVTIESNAVLQLF